MRRATVLPCLLLLARLAGAQRIEGVQVIGTNNARVNVVVTKDTAWLSMMMPDGSRFVVRTDSTTMASWADNAELLTDPSTGAKVTYTDLKTARLQVITFVRLSPESNSAYRVVGQDQEHSESLVLASDTVRVLFGAMRGEPQTTMSAQMPGLLLDNFHVGKPIRAVSAPPARYPESLRSMNVEGDVILSFIVDSTGHLDRKSIQVIRSSDPRFTSAAEDVLLHTQFEPAEQDGRRVTSRTAEPFSFRLSR